MRDLRYLVDPKRSLIMLALVGAVVWLLQASALPALTYLGFGMILFPFLLLLVASLGGILPSLLSVALIMIAAIKVYGMAGLWLMAYLLPVLLAFLVSLEMRLPFIKTAGIILSAFILSFVALFVIFQQKTGGNLYGALAQAAIDGLDRMPERDSLLYTLWRSGLISSGQEAGAQVIQGAGTEWSFLPDVVLEFYKGIRTRVSSLAASLMPGMLTTYSISLATLGLGFAVHLGQKRKTCPELLMTPFSLWHIPRQYGKRLLILAAGYVVAQLSSNLVLVVAGQMMYNVFFSIYAVQGIALNDYRFKARGMKPWLRMLLHLLLFAILPPVAMVLGIYDQATDPRKLRAISPQPDQT